MPLNLAVLNIHVYYKFFYDYAEAFLLSMFFTALILNSYVGNLNRDPPYQNMTSGEKGISLKLHNQFLQTH